MSTSRTQLILKAAISSSRIKQEPLMKPIVIITLGIGALAGGAVGAAVLGLFISVEAPAPVSVPERRTITS